MARSFNGTSDYIEVAHSSIIDVGAADFTVTFWYKTSVTPSAQDRFFGKGNSSGGTGGGVRYEMYTDVGTNDLVWNIDDNSTKSEAIDNTNTVYDDGGWHLYICERDYTTSLKLFEDGSTEVATGGDGSGNINNGNSLIIGAGRQTGDTVVGFCPGQFAEFTLFKRLLTTTEKTILGKGCSPLFLRSLPVFYLPMIGKYGPEIDLISGLTGTVTGAVASPHPRIIYPSKGQIQSFVVPAAPATGIIDWPQFMSRGFMNPRFSG